MENTPSKVIKSVVNGVVVQRILPNVQAITPNVNKVGKNLDDYKRRMKLERLQQNAEMVAYEKEAAMRSRMRRKYREVSAEMDTELRKQLGLTEFAEILSDFAYDFTTLQKMLDHEAKYLSKPIEFDGVAFMAKFNKKPSNLFNPFD